VGRLLSRLTCPSCGCTSDTCDLVESLSLDVPSVVAASSAKSPTTIVSLLHSFTATETLDADNTYTCSGCKAAVSATKRLSIEVPAQVLLLHLKRFLFRSSYATKVHTLVGYSQTLDLAPFLTLSPAQLAAAYAAGGRPALRDGKPVPGTLRLVYELCAFVVHAGYASNSGHYFSFVKAMDEGVLNNPDAWCAAGVGALGGAVAAEAAAAAAAAEAPAAAAAVGSIVAPVP